MANRYWIGNSGNWNDTAHWSTTSGGAGGASVPDYIDDVFFNASSFTTSNATVTLNAAASAKNIDWNGATNNPTFNWNGQQLDAYGQVIRFIANMNITNITTTGSVFYIYNYTNSLTLDITSGGKSLPYINMIPIGTNTTVNLLDNLTCEGLTAQGATGTTTFNTNNYNITTTFDFSIDSDWYFNVGTSTITAGTGIDLDYGGDDLNRLSAANTTFVLNGADSEDNYFYINANQSVGTVRLDSGKALYKRGTITNLILTAGKSYLFVGTGPGMTVTNITAVGTLAAPITLYGQGGVQFTLIKSSGVVEMQCVNIRDMVATGGATWVAYNSNDAGNNTGIRFQDTRQMLQMF